MTEHISEKAEDVSALVIPGGFGAAKNLSDFGFKVRTVSIREEKKIIALMQAVMRIRIRIWHFSLDLTCNNGYIKLFSYWSKYLNQNQPIQASTKPLVSSILFTSNILPYPWRKFPQYIYIFFTEYV